MRPPIAMVLPQSFLHPSLFLTATANLNGQNTYKIRGFPDCGEIAINTDQNYRYFSRKSVPCPIQAQNTVHIHPQSKGTSPTGQRKKTMKTNTRFIKSVVETAAKDTTVMPWARGARRAAFIAKRTAPATTRKTA